MNSNSRYDELKSNFIFIKIYISHKTSFDAVEKLTLSLRYRILFLNAHSSILSPQDPRKMIPGETRNVVFENADDERIFCNYYWLRSSKQNVFSYFTIGELSFQCMIRCCCVKSCLHTEELRASSNSLFPPVSRNTNLTFKMRENGSILS